MNKKQREILEKRQKELKSQMFWCGILILGGILLTLSVIGAIIGLPVILIANAKINSIKKELAEIEFKLAGD